MQELFESWWYGYLIVPIVITIFIGGIQAILTGIILARVTAFDSARMSAVRALSQMVYWCNAPTRDDYLDKKFNLVHELLLLNSEFLRLRQTEACSYMQYLIQRIGEAPWNDPEERHFPLSSTEIQNFITNIKPWSTIFAQMVFNLRPQLYPLITLQGPMSATDRIVGLPTEEMRRREAVAEAIWKEHRSKKSTSRQSTTAVTPTGTSGSHDQ